MTLLAESPQTSTWQPDWTTLNGVASSFTASTPLAARIKSVTPVGGYVAFGLQMDLGTIVANAAVAATPLTGVLAIAVDTLMVPQGDTVISAPGVDIVARSLQVAGGGNATLHVRSTDAPALEVTTASIVGSISVAIENANGTPIGGGPVPLSLDGLKTPQVLTVATGNTAQPVATTDPIQIADTLHVPWAIVALQTSSAVASVLIDQNTDQTTALAADMLRWVVGGCSALFGQQNTFTTVDWGDLASLQNSSIGLLAFAQSSVSGATYVPVLSYDVYQAEINALLGVAQVYDQKLAALADQTQVDQVLGSFTSTLQSINQSAETPLFNTLQRLAGQSASVQGQLNNAAVQLQQVGSTLPSLQQALVKAINDQFQQELVKAAVETLFMLVSLYVGAAATITGDPEIMAGEAKKVLGAAVDITKQVIEAGEKGINAAIADGAAAAADAPSAGAAQQAQEGAQYMAGSLASFGDAVNTLWAVVTAAIAGGQNKINMTPDLLSAVDKLPDLSGFSVGGLDPVTYWNAVVVQTQKSVQPFQNSLPEASAYLEAVQLAATFGSAVGDLQMKLLELYTQGMAAFDQLRSVYAAEAQWAQLGQSLQAREDQIDAATGLLQRGYLAVKRNLVISVENYRAAFEYQWLQPSPISLDVSMDYLTLKQRAADSLVSLQHVLSATSDGTVRPRQIFQLVTYIIQPDAGPLFTMVNSQPQAQWSITADDTYLAHQLGGNTGLFLSNATFELQGAPQTEEVQLQVATSGHYENKLGSTKYRFVSDPVSMTNNYQPGPPPSFITSWQFADAPAYLMPSPYTNWTLTVQGGNWQDATSIRMTLAGTMLQNP